MNKIIEQLNVVERKRWVQLRKQIASRKDDMWEWIEWVMEVRINKLFREEYSSFESYASADLGWSSRYANYMIEACETRQQLGTIVPTIPLASQITNEAQLRELSGVSEDKLPEVVAAAAAIATEEDKPISAKILRKARQQVSPKPKAAPNGKHKSKKPPEPEREAGDDPTFAEQIEGSKKVVEHLRNSINGALAVLKDIKEQPGTESIVSKEKQVANFLNDAKGVVLTAMPHEVCPRCDGEGCPQCGNHGWVNLMTSKGLRS